VWRKAWKAAEKLGERKEHTPGADKLAEKIGAALAFRWRCGLPLR
jgi:hypothetical protein